MQLIKESKELQTIFTLFNVIHGVTMIWRIKDVQMPQFAKGLDYLQPLKVKDFSSVQLALCLHDIFIQIFTINNPSVVPFIMCKGSVVLYKICSFHGDWMQSSLLGWSVVVSMEWISNILETVCASIIRDWCCIARRSLESLWNIGNSLHIDVADNLRFNCIQLQMEKHWIKWLFDIDLSQYIWFIIIG
jgi:hypothetical protein